MRFKMSSFLEDGHGSLRRRIFGIYCLLFFFNAGSWFWAVMAFHGHPVLLGTAFLAYSLGLRHAVDADHIAAIDNVTRKMMQAGARPVAVGFMFSLGHSTIVLVGAAAIAGTALTLQDRMGTIKTVGGVIGTLVSAVFLLAIAIVNLIVLRSIYRAIVRAFIEFNPDFPGTLRGGHVLRRHDRQYPYVGRIWMGVREASSQAVLQHDDYVRLGDCCVGDRRDRGFGTIGWPIP